MRQVETPGMLDRAKSIRPHEMVLMRTMDRQAPTPVPIPGTTRSPGESRTRATSAAVTPTAAICAHVAPRPAVNRRPAPSPTDLASITMPAHEPVGLREIEAREWESEAIAFRF